MLARRAILLGLAAAVATPAWAADKKPIPLAKIFPFAEAYLNLPPAERSRFTIAYRFAIDGKPPTAPMLIVEGERKTPLSLDAEGRTRRLPTLQQLQTATVSMPGVHGKLNVGISIQPLTPPAAEMNAAELAAALTQAAAGARKAAGIMSFAAPKLTQVVFAGPASGEVVYADGRRVALPSKTGNLLFDPAKHPGARLLRFPKAPGFIEFGGP